MDVENAEENDIRDMKATIPSVEINSVSKEKSFTKISIKASRLKAMNVDQYSALLDLPLGFVQFDNPCFIYSITLF